MFLKRFCIPGFLTLLHFHMYQNSCWSLKCIVTCSNLLYTCKLTNRNYVKFPYTSCKAQSNMMIHRNHFPVPFCLSVWHLFWNIICVSCFWEFFEQQAFLFSDTPLGLNILQTYLSMRFCSSLAVTQYASQWWTEKQALFHINLNICYHLKVPLFGKTDSTVAFFCCRQMASSMWEFNLKSVLLMPG